MAGPQSTMPAPAGADQEIQNAYARLQEMIGGMGQIDFQKMYEPLIQKTQARPETQMPSRGTTFAAAVGAPQATQSFVQDRMKQIDRERMQKESDVVGLQEQALKGHIGQLMQEGNFKKALAQSETLAKLQSTLDNIKRGQEMDDWKTKQDTIFGNKEKLQSQRSQQAENLVKTKAREIAKGLGFDERMALKLIELTSAPLLAAFRSSVARNPLTGEQDLDVDSMASWAQQIDQVIRAKAEELKKTVPGGEKETKGTGKTTSPAPKDNDPIRAAHAKLFSKPEVKQ